MAIEGKAEKYRRVWRRLERRGSEELAVIYDETAFNRELMVWNPQHWLIDFLPPPVITFANRLLTHAAIILAMLNVIQRNPNTRH